MAASRATYDPYRRRLDESFRLANNGPSEMRRPDPTTNPPSYSRLGTGNMVIGYPKRLRYHGGGVIFVNRAYNMLKMQFYVYVSGVVDF